jgi:hypothetical protein
MVNAWWEPLDFGIPDSLRALRWQIEIDTAEPNSAGRTVDASSVATLTGRSLVLLRATRG